GNNYNYGAGTNGQISNYYVSPSFELPTVGAPGGEPYTSYHSTCWSSSDSTCALSQTNANNLANFFTGEFSEFDQANIIPHIRMHAFTTSMFISDDWKVTRRFTATIGVRVEHIGRWVDDHGFGAAVFIPADYANEANDLNNPNIPLPAFRWHSIDSTVPIS